ncbi:receptor-like protein kinase, partial [Tanacetum coccineum]
LYERSPPLILDWSSRYKIALGTAEALAYLHFDCDPVIVHCDIKPMNILLDGDMEPHISDFGIAMLLDHPTASALPTSTLMGTIGYIAPENAFTSSKSRESDVYSYGVVLLELITRQKVIDPLYTENVDIVSWVKSTWSESQEVEMVVDEGLLDEVEEDNMVREQVRNALLVALRCTEWEPSRRPSMREVVKRLQDTTDVQLKISTCVE